MKKRWVWTLGLVFVLALTACGGNGTSGGNQSGSSPSASNGNDKANAEPVTIQVALNSNEISEELIKEFEADNPTIKIQRVDSDETKLAAQLATGTAPDIIRLSGVKELPSFVIRGIAKDLTEYFEKSTVIDMDDFVPTSSVFRFDGKEQGKGPIYGMPKDFSPDFTLFINKKKFEEAGVPLPSETEPMTWNEVFELAKRMTIKAEDGQVTQYGMVNIMNTEPDISMIMQYTLSKGVKLSSDDFSSINFEHPAVKEILGMWVDAVQANIGNNQLNQDSAAGGHEIFLNDKAAMILGGYFYSGLLRGDAGTSTHLDDYMMIPAPVAQGGERVSPTGAAAGAIIYKGTQHPDEAWQVYEWLFAGKPAEERAMSGWGVPALKSLTELMPRETDFDKQTYAVLQEELKYGGSFLEMNPYLLNADTLLVKHLTPVYFGKTSLDDALRLLTKDANEIIQEGMNAAQ